MCGLIALFAPGNKTASRVDTMREMLARIAHRGPDDEGYATSQDKPCLATGDWRSLI